MALSTEGIRKAAILITALDRTAADRLLGQMAPDEAQRVRDAVLQLGKIDPGERRRVIDEFFRRGCRQPARAGQGRGPEPPQPGRRHAPTTPPPAHNPANTQPDRSGKAPFGCLREAEADRLAKILAGERPQMIALVLSHLAPEQSGRVLVRLDPALQAEVIRRLVDLEETDPEVLEEIEQALATRLSQQVQVERPRTAGWSAVMGIVQAAGGAAILQNLAAHDPQLAQHLAPKPVPFEDLTRLDDADLAAVFRAAGADIVMLALLGAPEPLIQRVLRQLPPAQAAGLRHQMHHLGPTRLDDVQEARRRIEQLAGQLGATRQIQLPRPLPLAA